MKLLASALWGWGKAAILIEDIFENVVFVVIFFPFAVLGYLTAGYWLLYVISYHAIFSRL
jgi:hypothetical protein